MRFNVRNHKIQRDSNEGMHSFSDWRSMVNVMCVLLAKRAFSNNPEGVNSKKFSLAPLACLILSFFYVK